MAASSPASPAMLGLGFLPKEDNPTTNKGSWSQPSAHCAFEIVSCFAIDCTRSLVDLGSRLVPLRDYLANHPETEFLVTNRVCPVGLGVVRNIIIVSKRVLPEGEDLVFDRVWEQFKQGDDALRDQWIKYLPRLKTAPPCRQGSLAPWLLSRVVYMGDKFVSGNKPATMGSRFLRQKHSMGRNYVEIDVDVNGGRLARRVAASILRYCSAFTIDEAFTIEGLPGRVLCQIQFNNVDTAAAAQNLREEDYLGGEDGLGEPHFYTRAMARAPDGLQIMLLCVALVASVKMKYTWVSVAALLVLHPSPPRLAPTPANVLLVGLLAAALGVDFWTSLLMQWLGGWMAFWLLWRKAYWVAPQPARDGGVSPRAPRLTRLDLSQYIREKRPGGGCSDGEEHTCCSICLEPYGLEAAKRPVYLNPCAHAFHRLCIEPWVCCRATCPLCRRQLKG